MRVFLNKYFRHWRYCHTIMNITLVIKWKTPDKISSAYLGDSLYVSPPTISFIHSSLAAFLIGLLNRLS